MMTTVMKFRALCDSCESAEARVWCITERHAFCAKCSYQAQGHGDHGESSHELASLAERSVVSPVCAKCMEAPAATYSRTHGVCVCVSCVEVIREEEKLEGGDKVEGGEDKALTAEGEGSDDSRKHSIVELKETHLGDAFVFDRMDFSSVCLRPKMNALCTEGSVKRLRSMQQTPEVKVRKWLEKNVQASRDPSSSTSTSSLDLSYFQTVVPTYDAPTVPNATMHPELKRKVFG